LLYVGGAFGEIHSQTYNNVAAWNGSSWSPLGHGVSGACHALAYFDDGMGGGPALYVAGSFLLASDAQSHFLVVNNVARWDGSNWSALGDGLDDTVHALAVYDDGSGAGPTLYAGG